MTAQPHPPDPWDWVAWRMQLARARRAQRRLVYRRDVLGHDVAFALQTIEQRLHRLEAGQP